MTGDISRHPQRRTLLAWCHLLLLTGMLMTISSDADADAGATLRAKYAELRGSLDRNQFRRPMHLDSSEGEGKVRGDVYARVDHPFATVGKELADPGHWCDILILHLNTKFCQVSASGGKTFVNVNLGRKYDQPLEDTHRVEFDYRVASATRNYLEVSLMGDKGPLSTRDYRIRLEAIPLEDGRSFIHLTYSYAYGLAGRIAMQGYLNTLGRNKVGFTVVGTQADGQPRYVGDVRGAVERNAMRYYLAIEAFLGALPAPPQERMARSFRDWFAATERYPRQLHEVDEPEYLAMKRREYARQQADLPPAPSR